MKTFLICPVRGVDTETVRRYVNALEADGWDLHWPPRDTNQDDPTGLRICAENMAAISTSDAVHVVWDGKSQGCLFDLGVAFALAKRIVPLDLPPPTGSKSFQNMIRQWAQQDEKGRCSMSEVEELREELRQERASYEAELARVRKRSEGWRQLVGEQMEIGNHAAELLREARVHLIAADHDGQLGAADMFARIEAFLKEQDHDRPD